MFSHLKYYKSPRFLYYARSLRYSRPFNPRRRPFSDPRQLLLPFPVEPPKIGHYGNSGRAWEPVLNEEQMRKVIETFTARRANPSDIKLPP